MAIEIFLALITIAMIFVLISEWAKKQKSIQKDTKVKKVEKFAFDVLMETYGFKYEKKFDIWHTEPSVTQIKSRLFPGIERVECWDIGHCHEDGSWEWTECKTLMDLKRKIEEYATTK